MRRLIQGIGMAVLGAALTATAFAHCEIPCGIYDDPARTALMAEDILTVEKSMNEIVRLSTAEKKNYNQLVRWTMNKEEHATRIQETATQYFMFQRIKPVSPDDKGAYDDYVTKLTLLHQITVEAMKAKQTTDLAHVRSMRSLLHEFEHAYFGAEAHEHEEKE